MTSLDIEPWEPEESVGKIWHVFASKLAPSQGHDGARVDLAEMRGRLSVLFRGLGGNPAVELKPVAPERHQDIVLAFCSVSARPRSEARAPVSMVRRCGCLIALPSFRTAN